MSDRRVVAALVGLGVALLGIALIVLPLLGLREPVQQTDEGGTADVTRVLVAAIALGVLLLLAGLATTVGLVRAQLRHRDPR